MALIDFNKDPSRRELFWFGVSFAALWGIVGGIAWWQFGAPAAAAWIWIVGYSTTCAPYRCRISAISAIWCMGRVTTTRCPSSEPMMDPYQIATLTENSLASTPALRTEAQEASC